MQMKPFWYVDEPLRIHAHVLRSVVKEFFLVKFTQSALFSRFTSVGRHRGESLKIEHGLSQVWYIFEKIMFVSPEKVS